MGDSHTDTIPLMYIMITRVIGVVALAAALGIGYARYNIARIERVSMANQTHINLSLETDPSKVFRYRILERGANSEIETRTGPKASSFYPQWPGSPPMHLHTDEDEVFTVLSGTMGYILEGKEGTTSKGDLVCRVKLVNKSGRVRRGDRFFENLSGLAQLYGSIDAINPLQQVLTATEGGIAYTFMPIWIRIPFDLFACPLAKLVGYQAYYPEYRSAAL